MSLDQFDDLFEGFSKMAIADCGDLLEPDQKVQILTLSEEVNPTAWMDLGKNPTDHQYEAVCRMRWGSRVDSEKRLIERAEGNSLTWQNFYVKMEQFHQAFSVRFRSLPLQ